MNKQYKQFNFFGSVVVIAESQKAAERQLLKVMTKNAIGCSFSLSPPQAPVSAELLALPDKLRKRHEIVRNQEWTYRDAYDESADKLQSALAAESELRGLEREVAETGALTLLHTNSYQRDDGWLRLDGPVGSLPHMKDEPDIRYLELRGLLERHPDNPDLVRLKPAPPQEGE